jgi:transglutaminase/protease-like cytokinesis protein 3
LPLSKQKETLSRRQDSTVVVKPKRALGASKKESKEKVYTSSVGRYAYEKLSDVGKLVYDQMLHAILQFDEKAELSTTDTELMKQAYAAMSSDYGNLFWVEGYVFTMYTKGLKRVELEFSPNYTMSKAEQRMTQKRIDRVADKWLTGIAGMDSDYEKAKFVFETLIQKVDYVEGVSDSQNIISVFINRKTVCQGYACAAQYLLGRLGIASVVVTGQANGQSHAWNLVTLAGQFYYMDVTWGNSTYLGVDNRESKFVNYSYLTMTSAELLKTHKPNGELPMPECVATENSYYVWENRFFDRWQPKRLGEMLQSSWEGEKQAVSFKFSNVKLFERAKDYFIGDQKIADYCSGISNIFYIENRDLLVLLINF